MNRCARVLGPSHSPIRDVWVFGTVSRGRFEAEKSVLDVLIVTHIARVED